MYSVWWRCDVAQSDLVSLVYCKTLQRQCPTQGSLQLHCHGNVDASMNCMARQTFCLGHGSWTACNATNELPPCAVAFTAHSVPSPHNASHSHGKSIL